jgi:hypothetical protein
MNIVKPSLFLSLNPIIYSKNRHDIMDLRKEPISKEKNKCINSKPKSPNEEAQSPTP